MNDRAETLLKNGDNLFSKRGSLVSLWQEIADNFYPEREGFTVLRELGASFAEHLMTSFPVMVRRDLGNSLSAMLRPTGQNWFHMRAADETREDNAAKRWLEYASGVQRRAMYDVAAQFVRATKEGDHDFAAFGQCVLTVELNRFGNGLLYRCWHLKDVAWAEGYDGEPETVYRRWNPDARILEKHFPGKLHADVVKKMKDDPYCKIECCHIVIPAEDYPAEIGKKWRTPYVSIHIDKQHKHIMEEVGIHVHPYVIPRWQTVSGSQYAYSPATIAALPEARTIQMMTLTLLEAGEKATNPPIVAKADVFRDDFNYYAGGLTYADLEGDQNINDALQILTNDKSGIPFGMEMRNDQREILKELFLLNKIRMPQMDREITAYEASLWNEDFKRQTMPLFEPMEQNYNGKICERSFELLLRGNAFGPIENIPQSLRNQDVQFRFESPLHDAIERTKAQKFTEGMSLHEQAVAADPSAGASFDIPTAYREAMEGLGMPATWIRSEEEAAEIILEEREEAANQRDIQAQADQALATQERGKAAQEAAAGEAALNAA